MKVKMLIGFKVSETLVILKDELLEVREFDAPLFGKKYQVIDGQFSGIFVPEQYFIRISEERSYSSAEYRKLETELKVAKEDEERAVAAADQLQDNVIQLQRELTEAREAKKVVLPREVAEAIEEAKKEFSDDLDFIAWKIAHDREPFDSKAVELLKNRASQFSFFDLVDAIRYSYTVEEPEQPIDREQRLRLDLQQLFSSWEGGGRIRELAKDADELLTDYFSETT